LYMVCWLFYVLLSIRKKTSKSMLSRLSESLEERPYNLQVCS
jgi:hypothetical protein